MSQENIYYNLSLEKIIALIEDDPSILIPILSTEYRILDYINSDEGQKWLETNCTSQIYTAGIETEEGVLLFNMFRHGQWNNFKSGKLIITKTYNFGQLHGIITKYRESDSSIESTITYFKGVKHGLKTKMFSGLAGDIKMEKEFVNGKADGITKKYRLCIDNSIYLKCTIEYKNGVRIAKRYYNEIGILNGKYIFKDGLDRIKRINIYQDGIHLDTTYYYENGNIDFLRQSNMDGSSIGYKYTQHRRCTRSYIKTFDDKNRTVKTCNVFKKNGEIKNVNIRKYKHSNTHITYKYNLFGKIKSEEIILKPKRESEYMEKTYNKYSITGKLISSITVHSSI